MTRNTNNEFVQSKILENQLYEVLLYKKMEVLAIQERIAERKLGINDNAIQTALNQSKKAEILDYSLDYTSKLLFDLVEKIISIEEDLETGGHPMLIILHRYRKDLMDVSIGEFSLREKYHLLLYLEADISMIQAYLDIVGYTNEETIKEDAEKDVRAYIQKFRHSKFGNTEIHQ
ncbi:uncharacterized protein OCT59_003098 [Rhizophagus irregularis]|uniref:Uncharacterized protein n=2 Tax=Rhizophagus irregularis TaxID=588596 RepID=A0A015JTP0_RHIIW|nr:hypothetical protein RirG_064470 [Rhizophagus irregularis DAOM 197198w]UZO11534.1 hypothetical protein OCT59_003098 [Rhizophagus irregularis]GET63637.1 hypothetical protein GLOIN_2v1791227 [Rhizophagus irregularis DAOM 181602=DAOM 197198]